MPLRLTIEDGQFRDDHGRQVTLRGINLAGDAKYPNSPDLPSHIPDNFFDGDNVNFHSRPFPREEAHVHFDRLIQWGYNTIRYIFTWEAIEAAGPGKYDEEWIQHTIEVLREARDYGFYIFLDPHQDVWSRFTGGSGAPMWTLYACGLNPESLAVTEAALVHNTYPEPENFPKMIWATNYNRLACATICTLFFAGRDFASKCIIDGQNIQDYLQDHFIKACAHLAKRVHEAGDLEDDVVIGWESMNEPNRGLVGWADLTVLPSEQQLKKGTAPTAWQAILTGSGRACEVDTWDVGGMGPYRSGLTLVDPQGKTAWLPADYDDSRYGYKRDAGWKLGECVWSQHGVWDPDTDTLLRKDYFSRSPHTDEVIDYKGFTNTYFMDFYRRFRDAIRAHHQNSIIFCQPPVLELPPSIKGTADDDPKMAYAPHYYDGITLMTKKWNRFWNVDVFGVLRGRYLTPASAVKLGETAIRNCLRDQLSAIRKEGEDYMGNHPCVLTEFGVPFDMDDKHAYKTGDYSSQSSAMDANHFAVEGSLMGGYTLWQYMCQNKHQLGDQWNGEDLSIFSLDDLPLPLSPTAVSLSNESTTSLLQYTGLKRRESLDKSTVIPGNLKAKLRTPSITSRMTDVPELTNNPGFRAAEAYVRPSPVAIAGTMLSYGFDLRNCIFTLKLLVHETGPDAQSTDISLPEFHFPKDKCKVEVTSGMWTITTDDSDNSSIQRLRWWHLDGEQTIKVTGVPLPHHGPSSGPILLPPLPHALGIVPFFCVNGQKTLVMKEKVWTLAQGSFQIRDESNVKLLQCKAKLFSLHQQMFFYDMQGNELWSLKHKLLSIPRQYYAEGPDGREVFHVQGHWHLAGARMTVSFVNTAGNSEPIELALSGNWIDRYCTITWNDRPVAQITRDYFNTRQILGDSDTYYVTIAPGMDIALIVSLCVMYDEEMRKERSNQGRIFKVGLLDPRAA